MEFPDIGENCSWDQCKTLDFLPFTCSNCNRIFCKNHFNPDSHCCDSVKIEANSQSSMKSFLCTLNDCNERDAVEMLCSKCSRHFCLAHRYHNCFDFTPNREEMKKLWNQPKEKFAESKKIVEKTVNENIRKAMLNPKKAGTAIKIQLMKLKSKAVGSTAIPTTDRVYFLVALPRSLKKEPKAVFVNKEWSLGKVVDSVARLCNVINQNNQSDSLKLKFFKLDGNQISPDTSTKMEQLIESSKIFNGESLILEYVNPEEDSSTYVLENSAKYFEL